jgi:chromate transport protein ChrA
MAVAVLFLRLGFTALGGPAAHIAIMEDEVVRRKRWLSSERFLDLLGASNLIPGPSSTELAIFIGYERAGWLGLMLGGVCFILPAALMVAAFAWAYVHYGSLPQIAGVLYGIKPVVIAVVLQALWGLAPKAVGGSVWLIRPLVVRVRRFPIAAAFLDGVNVAALALMAVATVQLAKAALVDAITTLIALGSAVVLLRFRANTTWLVAGGAAVGAVVKVFS